MPASPWVSTCPPIGDGAAPGPASVARARQPTAGRIDCARGAGAAPRANAASILASRLSVWARAPMARAKSRAWRGLTTATSRPAACNTQAASSSYPPVASSTTSAGDCLFGNAIALGQHIGCLTAGGYLGTHGWRGACAFAQGHRHGLTLPGVACQEAISSFWGCSGMKRRLPTMLALLCAGLCSHVFAAERVSLLVYTALETDQIRAYKSAFEKTYPDVEIKGVRDPPGIITARLRAKKANPKADVVMGVAASSLALMDAEGMLLPYKPKGYEQLNAKYVDAKAVPSWVGMDVAAPPTPPH